MSEIEPTAAPTMADLRRHRRETLRKKRAARRLVTHPTDLAEAPKQDEVNNPNDPTVASEHVEN